ncbi:TPA: hypothetical protein ACFU38_000565 [Neisseria meningitidis]|uniref:hypothetical protein n=1 Tax=Neisseria meningitidis TaxID=487 RepID=UPI000E5717BB|nr:hypothetical protein [Neisseria meningitidis]RNK27753.1 hypothetical protein COH93_06330 [Neisseria meningitidis]
MPSEPPSDGIARHPKSTIKMAKKPNKPFRLTPKLLIRAVLLICITAIGALAIGIVSTFNPNGDKTLQAEPQHTDSPRETEFWLPNGVVGQDAAQPVNRQTAASEPEQTNDTKNTDENDNKLPPAAVPKKQRTKPQPSNINQTDKQPPQAEKVVVETPVLPKNIPHTEEPKETPKEQARPKENHTQTDKPQNTPQKTHKEVIDNLF